MQIPNVTNSFYTQTFLLYIPFQYIWKKPDTNKTQRTVIQKKIRLTMEDQHWLHIQHT